MALAQINEIERLELPAQSAELGEQFLKKLEAHISNLKFRAEVRGLGLAVGVELRQPDGKPATELALGAVKALLHRGYIVLPEGEHGNVIGFTPPLIITKAQLAKTVDELEEVLTAELR